MLPPSVTLRDHLGRQRVLRPGDLIGRAISSACRIDDARVSEAHALISLRGGALHILSLRGPLQIDGIEEEDFPLATGQEILLADGLVLAVLSVSLPKQICAIQVNEGAPIPLRSPVYSVVSSPHPDLVARYIPAAAAHLWSAAEGWVIQQQRAAPRIIKAGRCWVMGEISVSAVMIPANTLGMTTTVRGQDPLHIVARHTTVHIHRARRAVVVVDGLRGRLLSELVVMGCPVPWEVVAEQLWPEEANRNRLRRKWDRIRQRLTSLCRDSELREDLVRTDGHGNFELFLFPGDTVVDDT